MRARSAISSLGVAASCWIWTVITSSFLLYMYGPVQWLSANATHKSLHLFIISFTLLANSSFFLNLGPVMYEIIREKGLMSWMRVLALRACVCEHWAFKFLSYFFVIMPSAYAHTENWASSLRTHSGCFGPRPSACAQHPELSANDL